MEKIIAGWMAVGLKPYWSQFEGMKKRCEHHHEVLGESFEKEMVELLDAGIVDSEELARKTGERFAAGKVDILFIQMLTYASSIYIAPAVRNLSVPVVLLNVQYKKALDYENVKSIGDWLGEGITCAGVPEATAVLGQMGKQFSVITGHMEEDSQVAQEIAQWCRAVSVKKTLAGRNLGLLGRPYEGMIDLCVNENRIFEQFGTFVQHLDWREIIASGQEAREAALQKQRQLTGQIFELDGSVSEEDLEYIARTAAGLEKMAEKYRLHSYALHYEFDAPEDQLNLVAALNPAMTLLMTEGMSNAPEGDIRAAIAMVILKAFAGPAMTAELYSMDFCEDVCLVGHSGACDGNLSKEKAVLKMSVLHGKAGKGYVTQFFPEPGPVTMLALTETKEGGFKLVAAEGMGVPGPVLKLGDTNMRVKFPMDLETFMERWCMEGPTHHGVLARGFWAKALRKVAAVLGTELAVVSTMEGIKN